MKKLTTTFLEKKYTTISPKHFDVIIDGMEKVIKKPDGTAHNIKSDNLSICGKTGTAQNPHGEDHSIFIAFAPKEKPEIAIAVYIENGGWGSTWAAPIAGLMIEKYLKTEINSDLEKFITNGVINKR
jgi:penicillin-binding protein 2